MNLLNLDVIMPSREEIIMNQLRETLTGLIILFVLLLIVASVVVIAIVLIRKNKNRKTKQNNGDPQP